MSLDRASVLLSAWSLVHYMALRHSVASIFASEALPCNEERLVLSICLARLTVRPSPFTARRSALAKRGSIPFGELTGNDSFSVLLFAGKRLARVFCCEGADKGETKRRPACGTLAGRQRGRQPARRRLFFPNCEQLKNTPGFSQHIDVARRSPGFLPSADSNLRPDKNTASRCHHPDKTIGRIG